MALCGEESVDHARVHETVGKKEDISPEDRAQGRNEARVELPPGGKEETIAFVLTAKRFAKALVRFALAEKEGGRTACEPEAREGTLKEGLTKRSVGPRAQVVVARERNHPFGAAPDRAKRTGFPEIGERRLQSVGHAHAAIPCARRPARKPAVRCSSSSSVMTKGGIR